MKTWAQLRTEIQAECNIEGEDFVSVAELLTWANDAKDEVEAEIISLQERYLETETPFELVAGQSDYALPEDIFAAKITGVYFHDGDTKYEIKQITDKAQILCVQPDERYRYRISNPSLTGLMLKLYPASRDSSGTQVTLHYIRRSKRLILDTDLMDLPLAEGFIKQYIKDKVKEKEVGPLSANKRSTALEKQKTLLIEALVQKTPDDSSDQLRPDLSFYDCDYGDFY